jgi:hypothetical protein
VFTGLLSNALEHIGVVEALVQKHDEYARTEPGPRESLIKQYAVASCVTRLYAVYERFIESLISDYLDSVPELIPYASLSEGFKNEYRIGISHVLGRIESDRYDHLSHKNVIRWYHEALSSRRQYRIVSEAMTRHDQNLRLGVLESLVSRVDPREDFRSWLAHCPDIRDLYEEQTAILVQFEAELREFVKIRNDVAHGLLESLDGKKLLERYCGLIRAVLRATVSFFHKSLLLHRVKAGRMRRIGEVSEVFERSGAFVAQIEKGCEIRLGMSLHFVGHGSCLSQEINSIQIDNVPVDGFVSTETIPEVGIQCLSIPRRKMSLFVDS